MGGRIRRGSIALAAILGTIPSITKATSYTWTAQSGAWSDPTNWAGGNIPVNDPATVATINGNPTSNQNLTSTLDSSRQAWMVNGIVVNIETSGQLLVDPSSVLQFAGTSPYIEQDWNNPLMITGAIQIENGLTVNGLNPGGIILNGPIAGAGGINLAGPSGNLTLSGLNTFSGGVTMAPSIDQSATLSISQPQSLGTGNLTVVEQNNLYSTSTIAFQASAGNLTTVSNNIVVAGALSGRGNVTIQGSGNGTQTFVMQHLVTINNAGISLVGPFYGSKTTWEVQSLSVGGNLTIFSGSAVVLSNISETTPSTITYSGNITHLPTANVYSGGTIINGNVGADATGSLGSGCVTFMSPFVLSLNAPAAANNSVNGYFGAISYMADAGAGGHSINVTGGTITFGPAVTAFGGDSFGVGAGGKITGTGAQLALLDRGDGGTTPNFVAAAGAFIENTDGGLPTVRNLGTNADLLPIVHSSVPLTISVGTGTPWAGIYADSAGFIGALSANSGFVLGGNTFGNGTAGSFNVVAGAGSPVIATAQGGTLNSPSSNYSGLSLLEVTGALVLSSPNSLGGGGGSLPVAVDVASGGTLSVSNSAALNANVILHGGSTLTINAPGLTGSGLISRDNGAVNVQLLNANALSGSQINGSFLKAGDTVTLSANNVIGLKTLNPALHYVINGSPSSNTQEGEGFNINGGNLYFNGPYIVLQPGPATLGDSAIRIGPTGGTISAAGFTSVFVVDPTLDTYSSGEDSSIQVPILAQGPVNFSASANGIYTENGPIVLTNTANQFNAVNVNNAALLAVSPTVLTGANITLNGGVLGLISNITNSLLPPTLYSNPINVAQNSVITDDTRSILAFSVFPPPLPSHAIALANVTLANAVLVLDSYFSNMTIGSLTLTGDGTLTTPETSSGSLIILNAIGQDGNSARVLTFAGTGVRFVVNGNTTSTGAISVGNVTLEVDGTISRSTTTFSVAAGGTLAGNATVLRPVIFPGTTGFFGGTISPGALSGPSYALKSTPGTMTIDSLVLGPSTALSWDLGAPGGTGNDLVVVNGDLTLDGRLLIIRGAGFGPGTFTLMTYGGTLTDNGLTLPSIAGDALALDLSTPGQVNLIVTAVPEPAMLTIGIAAAGLVLGRRRYRIH